MTDSMDLHEDAETRVAEILPLVKALLDVAASTIPMDSKVVITRTLAAVLRGEDALAVNISGERKGKVVTAVRHCAIAWSYAIEAAEGGSAAALFETAEKFSVTEDAVKKAHKLYGEIARNLAGFVASDPALMAGRKQQLAQLTEMIWTAFPHKDFARQGTK